MKVKRTILLTTLLILSVAGVLGVWILLTPGKTSLLKHYLKRRFGGFDTLEKQNTLSDILKCAPVSAPPTNVTIEGLTCEQLINDKIVIAGAFSSSHFKEAKDMIASVQHFYPNLHIIIYDLGLTLPDLETLATFCNVHIRHFNFSRYPDYLKRLIVCAWKPLIALELSNEFEFIFYYDSSIRLMKPIVDIVLPLFNDFPFIAGTTMKPAGEKSIIRTTDDRMLEYLNISQSREKLEEFGLVEAGSWAMMINDVVKSKILGPWVDCALHKECIFPEGTKKQCDPVKESDPKGTYRGCHRFDQSALDMILIREFGINVWDIFHAEETRLALKVERSITKHYTIKTC